MTLDEKVEWELQSKLRDCCHLDAAAWPPIAWIIYLLPVTSAVLIYLPRFCLVVHKLFLKYIYHIIPWKNVDLQPMKTHATMYFIVMSAASQDGCEND